MTSLWTPDGERRVERDPQQPTSPPASSGASSPPGDDEEITAEQLAEMARLEQELLAVPVADVIANHCYGLFQLAALHLAQRPANLEEARLVIDALGGVLDTLGSRLGAPAATLSEGLAQVRLAFVEIAKAQAGVSSAASEDDEDRGSEEG